MENQILVKTTFTTRTYQPSPSAGAQIELAAGTIGVLTGMESMGDEQIAWVLWECEGPRVCRPILATFIEVVGLRIGKHSIMVE